MPLEERKRIVGRHLKGLEEGIAEHMRLARVDSRPHVRTMHVKIARLQNRAILAERKHWLVMTGEAKPREQRPRRPYVPTRPGETGYQEAPPPLAVLEIALAGGSTAEFVRDWAEQATLL